MEKKTIDYRIVITAIIAIAVIECFALYKGFNGVLLTVVIALIAAGAGIVTPSPIKIK